VLDDLFTFASDDVIPGIQTREQAIGVLSETLQHIQHITTIMTSLCFKNLFLHRYTYNDVEIGS